METKQYCPICNTEVKYNPRYINYVCSACAETSLDEDGKELVFYNESFSGGFEARYKDTNELRESHICYIRGIKCWADEARFEAVL